MKIDKMIQNVGIPYLDGTKWRLVGVPGTATPKQVQHPKEMTVS